MISLDAARATIAQAIAPLPPARVPLADALGCVLREHALADDFYPSVDRSMMDGYAIAANDPAPRFRIVAEITPGAEPRVELRGGECARVFTGAAVPAGATQVLRQEDVRRDGEWMIPLRRDPPRFIRARGEEAHAGDRVLNEGTPLGPPELAVLAQIGAANPLVSPRARVAHLATGDELCDPATPLAPGKIRDSNSALLAALIAQCGGKIVARSRCGDDLAKIVAFCRESAADVLLISGGASVGEHDFGARALRELGFHIHFDKVNLRPGKPLTFATCGARAAFVIPGNPVSHFVCLHVAIRLAIERLQAREPHWQFFDVPLGGDLSLRGDPRETFWPATLAPHDGRLSVTPKRWSSSGDTFSLAGTNALIRVKAAAQPGDVVSALPL